MLTVLSLSPAVDKIYAIDNFSAGNLYRVANGLQSPGGKGINVSRVLKMLGAEVKVLGFKAGSTGEWIEQSLLDLGAETSFVKVAGQSRTNNNIIDKLNNRETEILEEGPDISLEAWDIFLKSFDKQLEQTDVLVCSGGLPKGLGAGTYAKLITKANKFGVKTILDASGDVLKLGIEAAPYLIKPNLRELSAYFNTQFTSDTQIVEACREIINKGVCVVVTSLGGQGALLVTSEHAYKANALEVNVQNTIGSGDSMVGGISKGLSENWSIEECFGLGCACAASNTEFFEIGLIDIPRVQDLKCKLIIKEL